MVHWIFEMLAQNNPITKYWSDIVKYFNQSQHMISSVRSPLASSVQHRIELSLILWLIRWFLLLSSDKELFILSFMCFIKDTGQFIVSIMFYLCQSLLFICFHWAFYCISVGALVRIRSGTWVPRLLFYLSHANFDNRQVQ